MLLFTTLPFFALHIIGIFNSDQPEDSYHYLERTISFFLVPIIFLFFSKEHFQIIRRALLQGLVFGAIISILILAIINLYHYFEGQDALHFGSDLFNYHHTYLNFTAPLKQHPTYLGVYYLTAAIFLGEVVLQKKTLYVLAVIFGMGFLFLNSRIVFLVLLILVGYRTFQWIRSSFLNKKFKKIISASLIFGLLIILFWNFISDSYIVYRLKNIYHFELSTKAEENFNSHSKSNPRMSRYISALKLAREKPFFGHGTADERTKLKEQFVKDGLLYAAEQDYDSHNQYIGYAIRFGLFGVIILLFFTIANGYLAFREKEYNYLLFIIMIACVNLVENYFDRNYGITYSAIFFTTFTYQIFLKKKWGSNKLNS